MLHITNGDHAAKKIKEAGFPGDVCVWQDVLHEGPVFAALELEALSDARTRFIAQEGWGSWDEVRESFAIRDKTIREAARHSGGLLLWFEADLFDQLQLIQLLHILSPAWATPLSVEMICIGDYPGIEKFFGLGQLSPVQIQRLIERKIKVQAVHRILGSQAWQAFGSADPKLIETLLKRDLAPLPFLPDALKRHLEEFPSTLNGLSRMENQILKTLGSGVSQPDALFKACQLLEERPYMGDLIFWSHLKRLSQGHYALFRSFGKADFATRREAKTPADFKDQTLVLTDYGFQVLGGLQDYVATRGIDRWLGGVHLVGKAVPWRWDPQEKKLFHHST